MMGCVGAQVEAEEEPIEEELLLNALSEIRKREAMSIISGAETKSKVYVSCLLFFLSLG